MEYLNDLIPTYQAPEKSVFQLLDTIIPGVTGKLDVKDVLSFEIFNFSKIKLLELGLTEKQIERIFAINDLMKGRLMVERFPAKINSSLDAYKILGPKLMDLDYEEFWILCLNRANKVISTIKISQGGVTGTVADAKIIFRKALGEKACGLILFHNHPSGNLRPSQSDIDLTKNLVTAGKMLEITILDHLIIADRGYYSFADEGRI